jgi:epoxyqueuosine reductase
MKISNIQIETQRLLLKPISLDYKDDIFQEFTPEITIYLFSKAPDRIEETIEFIEGAIKKNNEGKAFQAVILDKSTGEFLGCAGLHRIDTQTPELGIWIKKSAHGNAFGEETIFALKKWVDENLDCEYLIYPVDKRNIASKRIPELMGGIVNREYKKMNMSSNELYIIEYRIMNKTELTQKIKLFSRELGFSLVGISQPEILAEESERLDNWISNDYHADMKWIENRVKERKNIFQYYPEVKSVISVGLNYFPKNSTDEMKISNYALGDDYHDLMKSKLYQLLKRIQEIDENVKGIACVDTSPVLDRVWAQKSGIGWIGKNSMVISKEFGSWIFLGELLLNIELEIDNPIDDFCGSCSKCIDACPTGALVEPYQVDANRCISYLTIEKRGEIDRELSDKFNGWIYGCDICQQVCPWNVKLSKITEIEEFHERGLIKKHSQENWENLTEEEFRDVFRKSAVKRTKFAGLKRNIEIIKENKK